MRTRTIAAGFPMIALTEAYRAGLFRREYWLPNIIAGAVVGVVALPLAMAFGIASGVKPEQGLYTAIVAGFVVSAFGGSRVQIAGPAAALIVVLADITAQHGVEGLQIATVMAGVILFALGVARMGAIVRFIPDPVVVGFTTGIGVIIWVTQWKDFFGLPSVDGHYFHAKVWHLLQVLPQLHPATTFLALLSLALMIGIPRIRGMKRVPGPLVALVAVTLLQVIFDFDGVATIGSVFGEIPRALPSWQVPQLSLSRIIELVHPAFAIAMLAAIGSLLSAVVADGMAGTRHDPNQELMGQGAANVLAVMFGGFAASGAFARTATNIRNGGTSPLAGIVHSLTLVLIILVFAPFAVHVPLAVLAAILFVVAWHMSNVRRFVAMARRAPRADVVILLVTFLLTIFVDLVVAVGVGVLIAMLHFLHHMASSVAVHSIDDRQLCRECADRGFTRLPSGVLVYSMEGPFFFGAVKNFERALVGTRDDPQVLIMQLQRVSFMDITGLQTLEGVISGLRRRGVRVMLAGASARLHGKLLRAGLVDLVGAQNTYDCLADAIAACRTLVDGDPAMRQNRASARDGMTGVAPRADPERSAQSADEASPDGARDVDGMGGTDGARGGVEDA